MMHTHRFVCYISFSLSLFFFFSFLFLFFFFHDKQLPGSSTVSEVYNITHHTIQAHTSFTNNTITVGYQHRLASLDHDSDRTSETTGVSRRQAGRRRLYQGHQLSRHSDSLHII